MVMLCKRWYIGEVVDGYERKEREENKHDGFSAKNNGGMLEQKRKEKVVTA